MSQPLCWEGREGQPGLCTGVTPGLRVGWSAGSGQPCIPSMVQGRALVGAVAGKHAVLARSRVSHARQAPGSPAGKGSICPDFPLHDLSFPCAPPPQSAFLFRVSRELSASPLGRLAPRLHSELPRAPGLWPMFGERGRLEPVLAGAWFALLVDEPRAGKGGGGAAPSLTRCSPSHAELETRGEMLGPQMPVACEETETAATGPSKEMRSCCVCVTLCTSAPVLCLLTRLNSAHRPLCLQWCVMLM